MITGDHLLIATETSRQLGMGKSTHSYTIYCIYTTLYIYNIQYNCYIQLPIVARITLHTYTQSYIRIFTHILCTILTLYYTMLTIYYALYTH